MGMQCLSLFSPPHCKRPARLACIGHKNGAGMPQFPGAALNACKNTLIQPPVYKGLHIALPKATCLARTVETKFWAGQMTKSSVSGVLAVLAALILLSACGDSRGSTGESEAYLERDDVGNPIDGYVSSGGESLWDIFAPDNSDVTVRVNKYIWNASLEVLDFLPVQSVDPFSGVIVTGYGVPPGGGRSYRATIFVRDPALDARSLHVAMQTRGGAAVSAATVKAVEDAILTRARQLRIADGKL